MAQELVEKTMIGLARETISDKLNGIPRVQKEKFLEQLPNLSKMGATFVTLTIDENLRGCIGSLVPHTTLYDDIVSNSLKAAFEDPRFPPLSLEEFSKIKVEISLIGAIEKITYKNFEELRTKIIPNQHGVILRLGNHQGTFLPQVWEKLPDFDSFMVHLFHKAGLDPAKVEALPEIFTYTVEKIAES